jgi:hypothetical protein
MILHRFDILARTLANRVSRRGSLLALLGITIAPPLSASIPAFAKKKKK